ncbi:hypothetical protein VCHA37P200_100072 [Vibrio chagasii]|nr:hypothetical protein VCHA38P215_100104 [Vibrio chagasii]CAH6922499.1 hypothetical protein VCHA53O468_110072 [Vibrio chagasii]CAH6943677.1 hypothetical protein VCHA55O507_100074 [Vibrio chagasii]CAH7089665.1 hypothetical protein VCHA37P200_100072 [Vibrio chagasii]CAH7356786.1 hypothetical protein VCHA48P434_60232 [Vibrio chagasii]
MQNPTKGNQLHLILNRTIIEIALSVNNSLPQHALCHSNPNAQLNNLTLRLQVKYCVVRKTITSKNNRENTHAVIR